MLFFLRIYRLSCLPWRKYSKIFLKVCKRDFCLQILLTRRYFCWSYIVHTKVNIRNAITHKDWSKKMRVTSHLYIPLPYTCTFVSGRFVCLTISPSLEMDDNLFYPLKSLMIWLRENLRFKNIQFIKQAIGMNRQHNNYSLQ